MEKLFIYYSLTGSGEVVAKELEKNGYVLRKVIEKKKMPKSFFLSMMSGGFRAAMNLKGKLIDYENDVSKFDKVVIGSPIWNGRITPAINAVIDRTNLKDKDLTFLFYSGSGEGKKALEKIQKLFPNAKYLFFKEPKKYPEELKKLSIL